MKRFYRIEGTDGYGIFHGVQVKKCAPEEIERMQYRFNNFPLPCQDNIDIEEADKEWFFAFTDLKIILNYITKNELESLIDMGFKVLSLVICPDCTQIGDSQQQVAFLKEGVLQRNNITKAILKRYE